jgi:HAD superfamily hydrolase (TIGR01549 family)
LDAGQSFAASVQRSIGRPVLQAEWDTYFNLSAGPAVDDPARLARHFGLDLDEVLQGFEVHSRRPRRLFQDALPTLKALASYGCVALSNSPSWLSTSGLLGAEAYLSRVFYSHEIGRAKPDPDAFRFVEDALGVPGSQILMVGDSLKYDYRAACAAGWQALLLDRDNRHADDVMVKRIGSLVALPAHLLQPKDEPASGSLQITASPERADSVLIVPVPMSLLDREYTLPRDRRPERHHLWYRVRAGGSRRLQIAGQRCPGDRRGSPLRRSLRSLPRAPVAGCPLRRSPLRPGGQWPGGMGALGHSPPGARSGRLVAGGRLRWKHGDIRRGRRQLRHLVVAGRSSAHPFSHPQATSNATPIDPARGTPRHLLNPDCEHHFSIFRDSAGRPLRTAQVMTYRGCLFAVNPDNACTFCFAANRYEAFDSNHTLSELRGLSAAGYKAVFFDDAVFTSPSSTRKAQLLGIVDELRRLEFDGVGFQTRADYLDREVVEILSAAGCRWYCSLGLESTDPTILRSIAKKQSIDRVRVALNLLREFNVDVGLYLLFGALGDPANGCRTGETVGTAEGTIDFVADQMDRGVPVVCTLPGVSMILPGTRDARRYQDSTAQATRPLRFEPCHSGDPGQSFEGGLGMHAPGVTAGLLAHISSHGRRRLGDVWPDGDHG